MTAQPKWKTILKTDDRIIQIDTTGTYAPEMEVADETDEGKFEVFRFPLERLKLVEGKLIPFRYDETWPHPVYVYAEWFDPDLARVAESAGTTVKELREAFCSEDPDELAWAYGCVGGYHGFINLDSLPLQLSAKELELRWKEDV